MWCDKTGCSYGSEVATFNAGKCPQCGNTAFTSKSPFPKKPLRSIRDMKKRVRSEVDVKSKRVTSEEVKEVIDDAKHLK